MKTSTVLILLIKLFFALDNRSQKKTCICIIFYNYIFFFMITLCFQISILIHLVSLEELISASSSLFVCECLYLFIFFCERYIARYKILCWQLFCVSFLLLALWICHPPIFRPHLFPTRSHLFILLALHCIWWVTFLLFFLFLSLCLCPW